MAKKKSVNSKQVKAVIDERFQELEVSALEGIQELLMYNKVSFLRTREALEELRDTINDHIDGLNEDIERQNET